MAEWTINMMMKIYKPSEVVGTDSLNSEIIQWNHSILRKKKTNTQIAQKVKKFKEEVTKIMHN